MSQKKQAASSARAGGITDGVIWEQLLVFFFPILFGAFFQQLYNTVDAVWWVVLQVRLSWQP